MKKEVEEGLPCTVRSPPNSDDIFLVLLEYQNLQNPRISVKALRNKRRELTYLTPLYSREELAAGDE